MPTEVLGKNTRMGPGAGGKRSLTLLIAAAVWILLSVIFLDVAWAKVADLRSAGQYVSPWRYGRVVLWLMLLVFWLCQMWISFNRYRLGRKVS